jgi:hypothetical protein
VQDSNSYKYYYAILAEPKTPRRKREDRRMKAA